jgi:nucleotide-binding universal stress UspA family protein
MPGTIVVGYDGSDGARAALDEALTLAGEIGAQVHLVFAYEAPRIGGELRDLDEAIAERGAAVLKHGVDHAAARGTEVTTEYRKADHAEGLIAAADEQDARYIVVGSYGERPLKSVLVGSTPTRLLHLSERPVLVVRAPE